MNDEVEIPIPPGMAPEALGSETVRRYPGGFITVYDHASDMGGVYAEPLQQWVLWFPVTPDEYIELASGVVARGVEMAKAQRESATVQ